MKGTEIKLVIAALLIGTTSKNMRGHRSERVSRKPFHCLSMRQRRRIRQEIKLIQESVEAESKRNQIPRESVNPTSQEQTTDNRIPQQGIGEGSVPQNIVYVPSPQHQMDNRVPQYQSSTSANSFPASQEIIDPLLSSSAMSGNFPYPINFLPGPSGYPATTPAGNGMPSGFKSEPFTANNQPGVINVEDPQQPFNHQYRNSDILLELKKLNGKLDTYNSHLISINARLENIERHVKQEKRKGQAPVKPTFIPMQTVQEVVEFDSASDEIYDALVQYLKYIGGFTLREALNLCMKEVLTNDVANNFTWHGKDTGHAQVGLALYNRQITNAFYEAVSQSQHFEQPTRAMFASQMREVLRIAKQRLRNSLRRQQVQQNFDGDRDDDPWE